MSEEEQAAAERECTVDRPMPAGAAGRWRHHDVYEIDCGSDYCAQYRCRNCGHTWTEELPE